MSARKLPSGSPDGGGISCDDLLEQIGDAQPGLGADPADAFGGHAGDVFDLERDVIGTRGRQIDLVDRAGTIARS
jgi:hypothetical protein